MRRKKIQKLIGCCFIMLIAFTCNAYANTNATESSLFSCEQVVGNSGQSTQELFSGVQAISDESKPTLSNMSFSYVNNKLVLEGELAYKGENIQVSSSGDIYKNEKTENAGRYDDLILADMKDFGDWHFVQLRIDKNKSSLSIILQNVNSKELLLFQVDMDINQFSTFYNLQDNTIEGVALERKILELYDVSKNLLDNETTEEGYFSYAAPASNEESAAPMATYAGWLALINQLKSSGSANLSTQSNIKASMFDGSGWQTEAPEVATSNDYVFVTYSKPNGTDEYLAEFALVQFLSGSNEVNTHDYMAFTQANYIDGMTCTYTGYNDTLSVLMYGVGIEFTNVNLAIGDFNTDVFFKNRTAGGVFQDTGSVIRAAIALSPAGDIYDIWDSLSNHEIVEMNYVTHFEQSYEAQKDAHNGKLIQGISAEYGDYRIIKSGQHFMLQGLVYLPSYSHWWNAFTYNTYTHL